MYVLLYRVRRQVSSDAKTPNERLVGLDGEGAQGVARFRVRDRVHGNAKRTLRARRLDGPGIAAPPAV